MVTNSDNKMHKEASEELYEKIFGITALSYFGLIENPMKVMLILV